MPLRSFAFPSITNRTIKEKITAVVKRVSLLLTRFKHRSSLVDLEYDVYHRVSKLKRKVKYILEDAAAAVRKFSAYYDLGLFGLIIMLGLFMSFNAASLTYLNTLMVLVMLVLIVVIYSQVRFQKNMVEKYVPTVHFVEIKRCQAYSERIRTVNLEGAKLRDADIKKIKNIRVSYLLLNKSFAPVSLQEVSLTVFMAHGGRVDVPWQSAIVDLGPSESGVSRSVFKLPNELDYDNIDSVRIEVRGNCNSHMKVKPKLYVNVMLRGKESRLVFEPYEKFRRRLRAAPGKAFEKEK